MVTVALNEVMAFRKTVLDEEPIIEKGRSRETAPGSVGGSSRKPPAEANCYCSKEGKGTLLGSTLVTFGFVQLSMSYFTSS